MFDDEVAAEHSMTVPAGGAVDDASGERADDPEQVSVRPPDLEPGEVRDPTLDVLAGWDVGADAAQVAAWRQDRRPFPADTVAVVGGGAAGLVAGLVIAPQHRVRGASLGLLAGVIVAAVVRQIWLLRN